MDIERLIQIRRVFRTRPFVERKQVVRPQDIRKERRGLLQTGDDLAEMIDVGSRLNTFGTSLLNHHEPPILVAICDAH
jgi:hypothetical protein